MLRLFFFLTYFTLVNSNITPGNMYDITWNDTESEQINLQLEVDKNGSWVSHKKDDSNFLSVILDVMLIVLVFQVLVNQMILIL
jgi:hypothetical protein